MKKIILLLASFFLVPLAQAQYYYLPFPNSQQNPGNLNNDPEYAYGSGLPADWATVLGPSNTSATWSPVQSIPFNFSFNGSPVTQYMVSSSGILTFDVFTSLPAPGYTRAALPSSDIPDFSVCIWGLAGKGFNDYVSSKTFGISPNRQLWVQFSSYGYGSLISDGSNFTFWSIVLEEGSNKIYIVDQRTVGYTSIDKVSAGIQMDVNTAYSIAGSPDLSSASTIGATAVGNTIYEFILGTQPNLDLAIDKITTSIYLNKGNNSISGIIKNFGADTIHSVKINYSINGAAPVSDVLTGISIPAFESYAYTHSTHWNINTSGAYEIKCYATEINGSTGNDQNNSNDTLTKTLNVLSGVEQRYPLFEVFTSSTCGPCKPGNLNFHSVVDTINPSKFVTIKYQQDFPGTGDPYTTVEGLNKRAVYYEINSIPRMEIDGGWDGNANSFNYPLYQASREVPAAFKMEGSFTSDTINKTYSAKVRYSPLYNATSCILNVAILEKKTSLNVKTNGESKFYSVMKKMLPDENGTQLSNLSEGAWDSTTFIYTFNGNYRLPSNGQTANLINHTVEHSVEEFSDLTFVGWISADDGSRQVLQAANFTSNTQIGIYSLSKNITSISVYPNPSSDFVSVEINLNENENLKMQLMDAEGRSIEIKNISGKAGKIKEELNLTKLASGFYHIAITDSKNNSFVRRIEVLK